MRGAITLHTSEDSLAMSKSGRLAAQILDFITEYVKPGVTTNFLDKLCHEQIVAAGAVPAPLNYKGFPKSICTSVNHVVCHGIPNDKQLNAGDLLNIDVTVILDGWHGDSSRMYWVGKPSMAAEKLTATTYEAMMLGIEQIKPGNTIGDIAHAIQSYAEKHHYSVVRDYCGHGIGRVFHDLPSVPFFGRPSTGAVLQEGMFFTVEPMINIGAHHTKLNRHDGWTVTTKDRTLSAQFEHTVGVTKDGCEIFTISPLGLHCPPYNI